MAEVASAERHFLASLVGDLHEAEEDLEILYDSSPFWSSFSAHWDLDDQHSEIDPEVFVPVFSPDSTPPSTSLAAGIDLLSDTTSSAGEEPDLLDHLNREIRFAGVEDFTEDEDGGDLEQNFHIGCEHLLEIGFGGENRSSVVGFGSGSEEAQDGVFGRDLDGGSDVDIPLYWDCLRVDEDRRDLNDEFEWEEVNGIAFDRDYSCLEEAPIDGRLNEDVMGENAEIESEGVEEEVARSIEWEVLLAVNNILDRNRILEQEEGVFFVGDEHDDDYVYGPDHDVLFGQFVDNGSFFNGTPPASLSVVESLPSVFLTEEDVVKNNAVCAVCKDDINLKESVKQLPCLHNYHGDCIFPWLRVRNTCPVCRYELPTDNVEYENWKTRRDGAA